MSTASERAVFRPTWVEIDTGAFASNVGAIHLKLASGMGRMGVTEAELAEVARMIRSTPQLRVDAIYTHFANADDVNDPFTELQVANFDRMIAALRAAGVDAPLHHVANS